MLIDRKQTIMGYHKLSEGGLSGTIIDPRLVFKVAIDRLASGIILAHNHPSGNIEPSQSDRALTQKIKEAGKFLQVELMDHVILGHNDYYSFKDEGELD